MPVAVVVSHVDTRARACSDLQKGITPCSTSKANPPHSGLDRLCYKNGPFVSSGRKGPEAQDLVSSAFRLFKFRKQELPICAETQWLGPSHRSQREIAIEVGKERPVSPWLPFEGGSKNRLIDRD